MVEFEVMVRPIKAPAAQGEEIGNRIGPQRSLLKQAAGAPTPIVALLTPSPLARACAGGGLVARIGRLVGAFLADSPDPGHAAVAQW